MILGLLASSLALALLATLAGCSEDESFPSGPPTTISTTAPSDAVPAGDSSSADTVSTGGDVPGPSSSSGPVVLKDIDPALVTGNFTLCPDCHGLLDQPGSVSPAIVASFQHGFHFEAGAKCADCHAEPTHTEQGIQPPPMEKCFSCHSQSDPAAPPGECDACHPEDFPMVPSSHDAPEWLPVADLRAEIEGKHTRSMEDAQKECSLCHNVPDFCRGCHGTDMPHPDGWQEEHKVRAKESGMSSCLMCHPGQQECTTCHHKGYQPGGPSWVEMHKSVIAAEGKEPCISCHSVKTCAHCHVTGEYKEYE
jgi:hypothetical protein